VSDAASRATKLTQGSPVPGCVFTPLLLILTSILSTSNPSLPLTAWHFHSYRMNWKATPLPCPRRKGSQRRRKKSAAEKAKIEKPKEKKPKKNKGGKICLQCNSDYHLSFNCPQKNHYCW